MPRYYRYKRNRKFRRYFDNTQNGTLIAMGQAYYENAFTAGEAATFAGMRNTFVLEPAFQLNAAQSEWTKTRLKQYNEAICTGVQYTIRNIVTIWRKYDPTVDLVLKLANWLEQNFNENINNYDQREEIVANNPEYQISINKSSSYANIVSQEVTQEVITNSIFDANPFNAKKVIPNVLRPFTPFSTFLENKQGVAEEKYGQQINQQLPIWIYLDRKNELINYASGNRTKGSYALVKDMGIKLNPGQQKTFYMKVPKNKYRQYVSTDTWYNLLYNQRKTNYEIFSNPDIYFDGNADNYWGKIMVYNDCVTYNDTPDFNLDVPPMNIQVAVDIKYYFKMRGPKI